MMDEDKWLTLLDDLLVDIFCRLDAPSVIRCAAACRPWRRAIIDNASFLRPRPGCFLPDLLLGFLDRISRFPRKLVYVPDPSSNAEVPSLFTPGTNVSIYINGTLYSNLLSSRDGFLLLGQIKGHECLCLCNAAMTGACKVLPPAPIFHTDHIVNAMYVLATGYDMDDNNNNNNKNDKTDAVWILAVKPARDSKDGMMYQIFSSTSGGGAWGPIKTSAKFPEYAAHVYTVKGSSNDAVVTGNGVVSWFVHLWPHLDAPKLSLVQWIFSVDLRTGRAWTTELPPDRRTGNVSTLVLAVSEDGWLSLVQMLCYSHQTEVWVLFGDGNGGGGQWTLRRKIDDVLPNCRSMGYIWLSGFCPRSGYLFGIVKDQDDQELRFHFVVGVDGRSSARLMGRVESGNGVHRFPYEMDSSTYISSCISKMKYF